MAAPQDCAPSQPVMGVTWTELATKVEDGDGVLVEQAVIIALQMKAKLKSGVVN